MLVPMYFLIGAWGSDRRLYAAIKFFLYTLAGSVVMLLAILALYFYAPVAPGATRTFDVPTQKCASRPAPLAHRRSEEHTSELQSRLHLVCRLLLEKKKNH